MTVRVHLTGAWLGLFTVLIAFHLMLCASTPHAHPGTTHAAETAHPGHAHEHTDCDTVTLHPDVAAHLPASGVRASQPHPAPPPATHEPPARSAGTRLLNLLCESRV